MFVLLSGNLSEGFQAFGPYDSFDEAAMSNENSECWIMTLNPSDSVTNQDKLTKPGVLATAIIVYSEPQIKCVRCGNDSESFSYRNFTIQGREEQNWVECDCGCQWIEPRRKQLACNPGN